MITCPEQTDLMTGKKCTSPGGYNRSTKTNENMNQDTRCTGWRQVAAWTPKVQRLMVVRRKGWREDRGGLTSGLEMNTDATNTSITPKKWNSWKRCNVGGDNRTTHFVHWTYNDRKVVQSGNGNGNEDSRSGKEATKMSIPRPYDNLPLGPRHDGVQDLRQRTPERRDTWHSIPSGPPTLCFTSRIFFSFS